MHEARTENDYASLESSFRDSPQFKSHKSLPRRTDNFGNNIPVAEPRKPPVPSGDDDTFDSQHSSPLASPTLVTGTDSGLPPTPPSNSQEHTPSVTFSPPGHADGVIASLLSNKSPLSTPVNQRSPPTPDPSPPRTTESIAPPQRPAILAYPSSRAESFKTALEEQSDMEESDRANTPLVDRLSTVEEDRGLGLAFEREDCNVTPTNRVKRSQGSVGGVNDGEEKVHTEIPNREWDTNLMRHVTIHRKRKHISQLRNADSNAPSSPVTGSTPRRSSSLRERVDASKGSPHTPSMEHFAKSIGWPTESKALENQNPQDAEAAKRLSSSSMASTVVEAMVIVTPPQRRRTLRHSGRNLAYRHGETSADQSPTTSSKRNSMNSDDIPLHRLVHKRATLSERSQSGAYHESPVRTKSPRPKPRQVSAPISSALHDDAKATLQPAPEIVPAASNVMPKPRVPPTETSISKDFGKTYQKRISSAPERSRHDTYPAIGQQKFKDSPPSTAPISARSGFDRTTRAVPEYPRRKTLEISSPESQSSGTGSERPQSSGIQRTIEHTPLAEQLHQPINTEPKSALAIKVPHIQHTSPSTPEITSEEPSPASPKIKQKSPFLKEIQNTPNLNKSLPELPMDLPIQSTDGIPESEDNPQENTPAVPESYDTVIPATPNRTNDLDTLPRHSTESSLHQRHQRTPSTENMPIVRRGSLSIRGRSDERRRSSISQDHTSTSRDTLLHPNVDRTPIEELPRRSYEWQLLSPDENRRVSFDRSTSRTEEHANARHLFSQSTPFSQFSAFSDTPELEVSEATAVSIYPHNNNSLLVVQSRSSTQPRDQRGEQQLLSEGILSPPVIKDVRDEPVRPQQPTLTFEPSTPPMAQGNGIASGAPGAVDSPLKNPRQAPDPPIIKFIPPTPAEELERQLLPGPPPESDARPKRRLSLVQRARRYSDNFISPILARASSTRGRAMSETRHEKPRVPSVNDEDGSLHPFWRPRGFWEGFDDDSESDSDDDVLPRGGDTSDIEDEEPANPPRLGLGVLGRRLTNNFKSHGGFHVGNSLGLERAGTNRRRPHVELPSLRRRASRPKIMIQPPTLPVRANSPRIDKYSSRNSMRSSASYERHHRERRRDSWRKGKTIPGLGVQVQYVGLSGMKERLRERKAEKRRDMIRQSIGPRYFVEGVNSA